MSESPTRDTDRPARASKTPAVLFLLTLTCLGLAIVGGIFVGGLVALPLGLATLCLLVATFVVSARQGRPPDRPTPIAYTAEGQPIYPVVGYTADGNPVTADRVAGSTPVGYNPRTNSLAVVALVLGIVVPPLAIPVAQVARGQIKRSGEQGSGLALAGLVLGWLSLIGIALAILVVTQS